MKADCCRGENGDDSRPEALVDFARTDPRRGALEQAEVEGSEISGILHPTANYESGTNG